MSCGDVVGGGLYINLKFQVFSFKRLNEFAKKNMDETVSKEKTDNIMVMIED